MEFISVKIVNALKIEVIKRKKLIFNNKLIRKLFE